MSSPIVTAFLADLDERDLEHLAERLAPLLAERIASTAPGPWRDVDEAAEYLRCTGAKPRQRIYDLVHAGKLAPRRDGTRLLFHIDDLDRYLNGGTRP